MVTSQGGSLPGLKDSDRHRSICTTLVRCFRLQQRRVYGWARSVSQSVNSSVGVGQSVNSSVGVGQSVDGSVVVCGHPICFPDHVQHAGEVADPMYEVSEAKTA